MKDKEHGATGEPDADARHAGETADGAEEQGQQHSFGARAESAEGSACRARRGCNEVLPLPFDEIVQIELRVIVEQIRSLNKSIAELEKTIAEEGSKLEGHKSLTSIKGIGKITGAILLSVIGDVNDFADEGRLASYFGIVPRVSNSNETEHSGRIHKRGTQAGADGAGAIGVDRRQVQSVSEDDFTSE